MPALKLKSKIMKHLIIILFSTLVSISALAQDLNVDRSPKSQDEFKNFLYEKWTDFQTQKQNGKKFPKLKIDNLIEILSYVPFDNDNKFTISYVRKVDSLDKAALYNKVYQSLVDIFVNAKNVMQMQDKETGIIVCKGLTEGAFSFSGGIILGNVSGIENVVFTLKIQIRDNRYKVDIYDIVTEKGDMNENGVPIDTHLTADFYNTSYNDGLTNTKRTNAHYINVRTQILLDQLYHLYQMEESLFEKIQSNQSTKNDW